MRGLPPAVDHRSSLAGGAPVPDPRSPCRPQGIHGPSPTMDPSGSDWTDHHWQANPLASAVTDELHVGSLTPEGTFDAASPKLDHPVDLGITHVEIMPVNEFSADHGWRYDGVDLFAPYRAYRGPKA